MLCASGVSEFFLLLSLLANVLLIIGLVGSSSCKQHTCLTRKQAATEQLEWLRSVEDSSASQILQESQKCRGGQARVTGSIVAPRACVCGLSGAVTMHSQHSSLRRFFAAQPNGGEVMAFGVATRMLLSQMAFELLPAEANSPGSPWVQLQHVESRELVVMQPPRAEGGWTLRLSNMSAATDPWRAHFCVAKGSGGVHLYSAAVRGYVTQHGNVLLRGHDGASCPRRPGTRGAASLLSIARVPDKFILSSLCDSSYEWSPPVPEAEAEANSCHMTDAAPLALRAPRPAAELPLPHDCDATSSVNIESLLENMTIPRPCRKQMAVVPRAMPGSIVAPRACVCGLRGAVALRGQHSPPHRFFSALPDGGEVMTIGVPSRMSLAQMAFEMRLAHGEMMTSPWLHLQHAATGLLMVMQPPLAEGGWTLRLANASTLTDPWRAQFCVAKGSGGVHLYSAAARGYVTQHGSVLLRGHGSVCLRTESKRNTKAGRLSTKCELREAGNRSSTSLISMHRVPARAWTVSESNWRCRRTLPANATAGALTQRTARNAPRGAQRLTVLTFASSTAGYLCDTLLSAVTHGLHVTVLGYGKPYHGNYQKLEATREYLANMDADDLVLFVDAYVSACSLPRDTCTVPHTALQTHLTP